MADLLKELEGRVEAAAKTIEKLTRENRSLKAKVKKLGAADDARSGDKAAWRKEREVVQKRLTRLASNLEELT